MSAFLGPIHYWLYRKIELQQALVNQLLELAKEQDSFDLAKALNEKYGCLEDKPLEDMIDVHNIHGWLQAKVSLVEYKLAEVVTYLLDKSPECMPQIRRIFYEAGAECGRSLLDNEDLSLEGLYKGITDALLEGMPCDHVFKLIEVSNCKVVWEKTTCVHKKYWQEVHGDVQHYYELRDAWYEGFAYSTGTQFKKLDEKVYQLERGDLCTQ